jgi:hypothetical protein
LLSVEVSPLSTTVGVGSALLSDDDVALVAVEVFGWA